MHPSHLRAAPALALAAILSLAACGTSGDSKPSDRRPGGPCADDTAAHCLDIALSFYKQDIDAAHVVTELICSGDYGKATLEACTMSGHTFRTGGFEIEQSADNALARYHKACPLEGEVSDFACMWLGIIYAKGVLNMTEQPHLPVDLAKGKRYLDVACSNGVDEACEVAKSL